MRATMPSAVAEAPAGTIAPAGQRLEVACPDLEAAEPGFEAVGADFEAAKPDFVTLREKSPKWFVKHTYRVGI